MPSHQHRIRSSGSYRLVTDAPDNLQRGFPAPNCRMVVRNGSGAESLTRSKSGLHCPRLQTPLPAVKFSQSGRSRHSPRRLAQTERPPHGGLSEKSVKVDYSDWSAAAHLLHRLDLSRTPSLIEPWLKRTVEAQQSGPALAGNGLHPVVFPCRPEPSVRNRHPLSHPH